MHAEGIPYQIFPGIFSSIDAYGKRLVHGWFDRHQSAPPWLSDLGNIKGYRNPPHYRSSASSTGKATLSCVGPRMASW